MRKNIKLLGAVAVAGLVAATGSAFTATGLATTAGATQFVGGTVSQSVTGATLSSLVYGFTDTTKTAVNSVTLTFGDATGGKTPTISLTGGTATTFTCGAINSTSFISVCNAGTGLSQSGVTSAAVSVA